MKKPDQITNAIGGQPVGGMIFSQRDIWDRCVEAGKLEIPEIKDDRPAIRKALREARMKRGVKVRSQSALP